MERLRIINFGPIREISIEIKDINLFIGTTSSGKSSVAKLISIFKNFKFKKDISFPLFKSLLQHFNIDFEFEPDTLIEYTHGNSVISVVSNDIKDSYRFSNIAVELDELFDRPLIQSELSKINIRDFYEVLSTRINYLSEDNQDLVSEALSNYSNTNNSVKLSKEYLTELEKLILQLNSEVDVYNDIYIPAERMLIPIIAESMFGLSFNQISLPGCVLAFGAKFESARKNIKSLNIDFLDIKYEFRESSEFLTMSNSKEIKLSQASSGLLSSLPLIVTLQFFFRKPSMLPNYFVIEEPELNLYPNAQKDLTEFIIEGLNQSKDKIIITTHSPYLLTTLDNLIQAGNVSKINDSLKDKVRKIVPEKRWVDFEKVSCYFFDKGTCYSTLDDENKSIGPSNIDDVSSEIGIVFEKLLDLKYSY